MPIVAVKQNNEPQYLDVNAVIKLSQGVTVLPPPGWKLSSELSIWDIGTTGAFEITRQSGPIVNDPQIYNLFVGDWSSQANQERIKRLNQFTVDMLNSSYMTILSQYGCTAPGNFIKSAVIPNSTKEFTDRSLQQLLQRAIDAGSVPEPKPNDVLMVYLPDDAYVKDAGLKINLCSPPSGNAFGYHHYFKTTEGNKCYYAIIPGLTDACLNSTCYGELNCSLKLLQTQEERQTQVASHEILEVVTNPESNAWYDVAQGSEIADICNGYTDTIKVGNNTWKVQQIYSKQDDIRTNGKSVCVAKTDSLGAAPTGNIATSILGKLQPDFTSTYNFIGGASLLVIAMLLGGKSIVGKLAFGVFGFLAGFYITDMARHALSTEQKNLVKDEIAKIV